MIVYLAGGMKSGWRQQAKEAVPEHEYLDPCEHGLSEEGQYTLWDLMAIDASDLVFACFEAGNPSGLGLSLEIGYARKGGKAIILVDEKSATDEAVAPRLGMLRSCADTVVQSLNEGLCILQALVRID